MYLQWTGLWVAHLLIQPVPSGAEQRRAQRTTANLVDFHLPPRRLSQTTQAPPPHTLWYHEWPLQSACVSWIDSCQSNVCPQRQGGRVGRWSLWLCVFKSVFSMMCILCLSIQVIALGSNFFFVFSKMLQTFKPSLKLWERSCSNGLSRVCDWEHLCWEAKSWQF